jgi:bifunctional non-homologous end joining protein LigD
VVRVDGRELRLSNLEKVLWPEEGITKAEVIKYYVDMGRYIIPFLKNRPIMALRYPHGIDQEHFVQKHFTRVPAWVRLFSFKSEHYVLCNDLPTLVWLSNLAAIEINHMLARSPTVTKHDLILIDLDPHPPAAFNEARIVARGVATLLEKLELDFLVKTSGADGIHFFIPVRRRYSVEKVRRFVYAIGKLVEDADPKLATVSTRLDRKTGHVYVDFLQNALERTITAALSIRALPKAPVSFPLTVRQLDDNLLSPKNFTVRTTPKSSPALRNMLRLGALEQSLDEAFSKLGIKA